MVSNVEIHIPSSTIILDSVTFCIEFGKVRIEGGHPSGPVDEDFQADLHRDRQCIHRGPRQFPR
jgi:hypothetical protein